MIVALQHYWFRWPGGFAALFLAANVAAQLEIPAPEKTPAVFGGGTRAVHVIFRNPGERTVDVRLTTHLWQLSSSTRMPVGEPAPWKNLTVLGEQMVLETARLNFPDVRAVTHFEVRWLDETKQAIGLMPVTAYPTNLLQQLRGIDGPLPPGVFDPQKQLTPLLRALNVEFDDLTEGERLTTWRGRLAIMTLLEAKQSTPRRWIKQAEAMAERGANTLLLTPAEEHAGATGALRSAVFVRAVGGRRLVTAPSGMVADLATDPLAQESLLALARLAVATDLPQTEHQP